MKQPYKFIIENKNNTLVPYFLFQNSISFFSPEDSSASEKNLITDALGTSSSYEDVLNQITKHDVKFSKIGIYSNSIIQKRIPIEFTSSDLNGQRCTIPMVCDEKEEISVNFDPASCSIELSILPNSISVIYLYE